MFRSYQIIIRELCSLLKLYYSIPNSIRICKRGVVAAYHVVWECVVEQWLGMRRTTHSVVDKLKWINWELCALYSLDPEKGGNKLHRNAITIYQSPRHRNTAKNFGNRTVTGIWTGWKWKIKFCPVQLAAKSSCFSKAPGMFLGPTHIPI